MIVADSDPVSTSPRNATIHSHSGGSDDIVDDTSQRNDSDLVPKCLKFPNLARSNANEINGTQRPIVSLIDMSPTKLSSDSSKGNGNGDCDDLDAMTMAVDDVNNSLRVEDHGVEIRYRSEQERAAARLELLRVKNDTAATSFEVDEFGANMSDPVFISPEKENDTWEGNSFMPEDEAGSVTENVQRWHNESGDYSVLMCSAMGVTISQMSEKDSSANDNAAKDCSVGHLTRMVLCAALDEM